MKTQGRLQSVLILLNSYLSAGTFEGLRSVDDWLRACPSDEAPVIVLGALSITYPAKTMLIHRKDFLMRTEPYLKQKLGPARADKLLKHRR